MGMKSETWSYRRHHEKLRELCKLIVTYTETPATEQITLK